MKDSLDASSLEKLYLCDLGEEYKIQAMICLGTLAILPSPGHPEKDL